MHEPATTDHTQLQGKYLTILLAGEAYGLNVLNIREIIRLQKITPVAQLPAYIKGVINLRGRVVPVLDLRLKFGMPAGVDERTCIVVVRVRRADLPANHMGLIVDAVEEVVSLAAKDIEPTPDFGVRVDTAGLLGMAKVKDRVTTLLDLDRTVRAEAALTF